MYLFFDTETTGLPLNYKAPVSDLRNWPRMVQLAWMYFDKDGRLIESADNIIYPDGFTIPREASRIHGITTERAMEEGRQLRQVITAFGALVEEASLLVAHNISFDENIAGAEFLRCKMRNPFPRKEKFCTMQSTVNFCALPGKYGFKWPKLNELHRTLFNADFEDAHNAMNDIAATAKCFWELKKLQVI